MVANRVSYCGLEFASSRKGRYAVIFDVLGLRWEYRPVGFFSGGQYRPDFSLPHAKLLVEVGAEPLSGWREQKVAELRREVASTGWQVRVMVDNPLPLSAASYDAGFYEQVKLQRLFGFRDLEIRAVQVALNCARKVKFGEMHIYSFVAGAKRDVENVELEARDRLRSTHGRAEPGSAVA